MAKWREGLYDKRGMAKSEYLPIPDEAFQVLYDYAALTKKQHDRKHK